MSTWRDSGGALPPGMRGRADEVSVLREDMDHVPGQLASQRRIRANHGAIYAAWSSLDLFPIETAEEYLQPQLQAVKVPRDERERLLVVVIAFAMLAVEADRENREG